MTSPKFGTTGLPDPTRREFHRLVTLAGAGLAAASILGPAAALGRQRTQPTRPQGSPNAAPPGSGTGPASALDAALRPGRMRDWTLKATVNVRSYQEDVGRVRPGTMPTIVPFDFTAASILFPVLAGTSASRTRINAVQGTVRWDGRETGVAPSYIEGLHSGARFARWDLGACTGRDMDIDVEIPMSCWETVVDEKVLALAKWPKDGKWPAAALSSFGPQMGVENGPIVNDLVAQWCNRQSPQSIPPLQLAKFLAAKVIEHVQPSGDGLSSSRTGLLQGFDLRGSERTLAEKRGSVHDATCAMAAVYRAAGVPARTVIGLDVTRSKGQDRGLGSRSGGEEIRSWVEVCFCDEKAEKETWVPVDIVAQRRSSSRAPAWDRTWKWFGNNEDTDDIMPVALHFHPPAQVAAHGSPAFWGWNVTPEIPVASQTVRLTSITTPVRPAGRNDRTP
jgi:hypothetical protein